MRGCGKGHPVDQDIDLAIEAVADRLLGQEQAFAPPRIGILGIEFERLFRQVTQHIAARIAGSAQNSAHIDEQPVAVIGREVVHYLCPPCDEGIGTFSSVIVDAVERRDADIAGFIALIAKFILTRIERAKDGIGRKFGERGEDDRFRLPAQGDRILLWKSCGVGQVRNCIDVCDLILPVGQMNIGRDARVNLLAQGRDRDSIDRDNFLPDVQPVRVGKRVGDVETAIVKPDLGRETLPDLNLGVLLIKEG